MSCFFVNGKGLRKYCLENGIVYSRVYYWLDKKGLSVEESIKKATGGRIYPQTKFKSGNETIYGICRDKKITYNSVVRDIKRGINTEMALKKAVMLKGQRGRMTNKQKEELKNV